MLESHGTDALFDSYQRAYGRFADWKGFCQRTDRLPKRVTDLLSPLSPKPITEWLVLDLGCGGGAVSVPLARRVRTVVGLEVREGLVLFGKEYASQSGVTNVSFVCGNAEEFSAPGTFDVVLMIDVLEHIKFKARALHNAVSCLVPGGVLYVTTNNRLWPIEAHYRLVGLQFLPRRLQNAYIRLTGRPGYPSVLDRDDLGFDGIWLLTLRELREMLDILPLQYELRYLAPADARAFESLVKRFSGAALEAFPYLWNFFVGFHVVARRLDG